MKFKMMMVITLVLLSLLMIGAVSATEDMGDLVKSNVTNDVIASTDNGDGVKISASDNINEQEVPESFDTDSNDILKAEKGNNIVEINDDNYKDYFDENGSILENGKIVDNDTLILENINDKTFKITKTLFIGSNHETLNDVVFIFSEGSDNSVVENLTINNFGDLTAITINNAENISILSSEIHVESLENSKDVMAIYVNSANNLEVWGNYIKYIGKTNGTGVNNAVRVIGSYNVDFTQNDFNIEIPGGDIDNATGFGTTEGIVFDACPRLGFENNTINLVAKDAVGSCPTVRVIHMANSDNTMIGDNVIEAFGDVDYLYGVKVGGDDLFLIKNSIGVYNDKDYARGIEIATDSTGTILRNDIYLESQKVAQGIYSAFDNLTFNGPAVDYENNFIECDSRLVYGMELFGVSSFQKNKIFANGDYAVGIALMMNGDNVSSFEENQINVSGLKDDADVGDSIFPAVTVGIYTVGNSQIQNNIITSTGNQTIISSNDDSNITDNYLVSAKFLGDESVLAGNEVKVKDNVPISGATNYDVTEDNYKLFFEGSGILRNNITSQSLTFHGSFSELELDDDVFIIDRPIALLGDDATLDTTGFEIRADNVIVDGFNFKGNALNRIYIDDVANISIINNNFLLDDVIDEEFASFNVVIRIIDSEGILIDNNDFVLNVTFNDTLYSRVIWAQYSDYVVVSNNTILAGIPSRSINWASGEVYSEGVYLDHCDNVILAQNIIGVASTGYTSTYDSIYGVYITGENVTVCDNDIAVVGAPYGYGLVMSVENFTVYANMIFTGINLTDFLNSDSASFFSGENYFNVENTSEFYGKLVDYADSIKGYLKDINPDIFTPYACAVDIESNSWGLIEFNLIGAAAISQYGIYTANWAGDVKIKTAFNLIFGLGNSAFGMSLSGSEALVKYTPIALFGNFTTGIASAAENISIMYAAIDSIGSNEGTHLGYDMMGIETTGIHIVSGNANITKNIVNTTGSYAVDFKGEGSVTENYLVAEVYTGDASVDYTQGQATVRNNTPKMQIKINANNIDAFWDENIKCYVNVTEGYSPLSNVIVKLSVGNDNYTNRTDKNGVAIFDLGKFNPGNYNLIITAISNSSHVLDSKTVNLAVNKLKTKIAANAKTFKDIDKVKKYTIVLKDNRGNAIKKAKVYLRVNGKTYSATTNSKGQATFKLKKLTKTGKYKAVIAFKGNKYYTKITKNVKIAVKNTFKTVSRGSKNNAMTKKIQRALKNNGYYLTYNGHYLKVDGNFGPYTEWAVKEFQKDKGLKVTGKVDYTTAKKLKLI